MRYCIFIHKDIAVFVTNTPVFKVRGMKQCNPLESVFLKPFVDYLDSPKSITVL